MDFAFSIRFFRISYFFSICCREFMFFTFILNASSSSIALRRFKCDGDYFFVGASPTLMVVSLRVLLRLSGRGWSLMGVPKVMLFFNFAHYFWSVASCMDVKLRVDRFGSLLAIFSTF